MKIGPPADTNLEVQSVSAIASSRFLPQVAVGANRMEDGFTDLLACITHDRGLFLLSTCNEAVVSRWFYASCWWRHGVVLRSRISTIGNASTDTVCMPNHWPIHVVIESYRRSRALRPLSLL